MRRIGMIVFLLIWLPCCALAAPDTPYAPETVVQTGGLSEGALAALDVLYPAIRACKAQIDLPGGTLYDDACAAMQSLSRDYPELFHLDNAWVIAYRQDNPAYATQVMPGYRMTAEAYDALLTRLLEAAGQMVSGAHGDEADRAEALHDLLCDRAAYDESELGEADNTAVGALLDGVTRCEGYAEGLALLYRLSGIPCGVVTGETGDGTDAARHAWNVAVMKGQPTLIDATWDDQEDGGNTHWYHGLTSEMMAADHTPDPELAVPECVAVTVNWHARQGLLVSDETGIFAVLRRFAQDGEVSARFMDAALYADFYDRPNEWFSAYNAAYPHETFYGRYSVIASPDQLCMRLLATEDE